MTEHYLQATSAPWVTEQNRAAFERSVFYGKVFAPLMLVDSFFTCADFADVSHAL